MDSKNYTQVLIDGKIYTLGGSEDEAYLQKAASYVNDKNGQMRRLPGFSKQNADYQMVMTELNIADDYFKALEWGEGMERQKNDMEKETYSLKHELVSTQMKLEAVLKDLEERQKELDRLTRSHEQLESELKEAREALEAYKDSCTAVTVQTHPAQKIAEAEAKEASQPEAVPTLETIPEVKAAGIESPAAVAVDSAAQAENPVTQPDKPLTSRTMTTGAAEAAATAATLHTTSISDEELAKKALQAAKKANSHRGGRR